MTEGMVTTSDSCTGNGVEGDPQLTPSAFLLMLIQIWGGVQRLDGDRCFDNDKVEVLRI
jgi:hypothetical protein